MEERRLKRILSHLSPQSPSIAGRSDVIMKGRRSAAPRADIWNSHFNVPKPPAVPTGMAEYRNERNESNSQLISNMQKSPCSLSLEEEPIRCLNFLHKNSCSSSSKEESVKSSSNEDISVKQTIVGSDASAPGKLRRGIARPQMHACCNGDLASTELSFVRCAGESRSRTDDVESRQSSSCGACIIKENKVYLEREGETIDAQSVTYSTSVEGSAYCDAGSTMRRVGGSNERGADAREHCAKDQTEQDVNASGRIRQLNSCLPAEGNVNQTAAAVIFNQHTLDYGQTEQDVKGQTEQDVKASGRTRPLSSCLPAEGNVSQTAAAMTFNQHSLDYGFCESLVQQDFHAVGRERLSTFQALAIDSEASGTMSVNRNIAMTGQRRFSAEDCIFCLIIQSHAPAFKIYEDEMCICILDVHPLSHGHSLIIPKAHFPSLELTPPEVAAAMCAIVPHISMAIMEATNCDSFNLLVNSGKAAGQVVLHTHFHIIPRKLGDNLWRSEDGSRRQLPMGPETSVLVQQIRHKLASKHI